MKIGLVGGSYQEKSLPLNAQRSVNLFPVVTSQGKEESALYGTAGLQSFGEAGTGAIRGTYAAANGRAFCVSGSKLFELASNGTETDRGNLLFSAGAVSMVENGFQLAICDGTDLYMFTYATNVFAKVTDPDLPNAKTVTFLDGYFIVNQESAGTFYISSLYDGTTWNALDFATAESSPDELLRVTRMAGQLVLLGTSSGEIWSNTGDSTFPFERVSGATMTTGILAPLTAVEHENTLVWVGQEDSGDGQVFQTQGFTPARISTHPIELIIRNATDKENMRAWSYQEEGHDFYVLTGGGLGTTLVYDFTTQVWHERAFLNQFGIYEQHLGADHMYAFGKHIVGSRKDGKLYEMSMDFYTDAGDPIKRERIYTHLVDEDKRIRYNELVVGFETGVGLQSGQGSNPLAALQLSDDGARTWSDEYYKSIGAVGEYKTRVAWRRLGVARQMTFRLTISEPVKIAITGSFLS